MNRKTNKIILAAVLCTSVLCGCTDISSKSPKASVTLDVSSALAVSSAQDEISHVVPDMSQIIQSKPVSSSTSSVSSKSVPQFSSRSTQPSSESVPQSSSRSTQPSSESVPQSSSRSTSRSSSRSASQSSSKSTVKSSSTSSSTPTPLPTVIDLDTYKTKWAYNQITPKQQKAYVRLFGSAKRLSESCDISDLGLTEDDIYTAYWAFDYDNPQFLELGSGYSYSYVLGSNGQKDIKSISIDYSRTPSEVPQDSFNNTAQNVLAGAQSQKSDYEKLLYVHDWIVNNTVYLKADADYESEADGPVVYGKAICEGYSKTFMYFAQSMGYECVCVVGGASGTDHMWNMVKIGGQWYHVDVTWDDPVMSDGSQTLRRNYFLISDTQLKRDHSIDSPFRLPSAPQNYVQ